MNVDERFKAKLEARASGKAPVFVVAPEVEDIKGESAAAVDARYRLKLAAREKAAKAVAPVAAATKGPEHAQPEPVVATAKASEPSQGEPQGKRK